MVTQASRLSNTSRTRAASAGLYEVQWAEQNRGDAPVARACQGVDGGGLNVGGVLRLEQSGQHGQIGIACVGEA